MGQINKHANLYREERNGELILERKAPLKSIAKQGAPISTKYPGQTPQFRKTL